MKTIKFIMLCFSLGLVRLVPAQNNLNIYNNNGQSQPTVKPADTTTRVRHDDRRDMLEIGIKGGANYTGVWNTQGQNLVNGTLWGGAFGAFLSIPLGTYLGLQPEVMYSQKGYSQSGTTDDGSAFDITNRTDWIDVPLLIQLKPAEQIYILGGPMYSYLLHRDVTFNNGVTSGPTQQEFRNLQLNKNILGIMFGLDINIFPMVLSGRVGWDLINNYGSSSTVPQYRNVMGQVTLGFRF